MAGGSGARSGTVWAIGGAVAGLLCALVAIAWAVVPTSDRAVLVAPAVGLSTTPVRPSPAIVAGLVTTGPKLPEAPAGLVVRAAIAADGAVLVNEQLSWTASSLPSELVLHMQTQVSGPGIPAGTQGTPVVSAFQVELDGQVVQPSTALVGGLRTWTIPTKSAHGSTHVLLARYLLTGATVRSTPAPAGRATVVLAPLLDPLVGTLPAYLSVTGPSGPVNMLAVNCPLAPVTQIVCGTKESDGWVIGFGPGQGASLRRVTVQVDLV